jgi:hypothetical protein
MEAAEESKKISYKGIENCPTFPKRQAVLSYERNIRRVASAIRKIPAARKTCFGGIRENTIEFGFLDETTSP